MAAFADCVWETRSTALSLHNPPPRSPSPMDTRSRPLSRASSPAAAGPTRLPGHQPHLPSQVGHGCPLLLGPLLLAELAAGKRSSRWWVIGPLCICRWRSPPPPGHHFWASFPGGHGILHPQHRLLDLNSSPLTAPLCQHGGSTNLLCPFPPTNLPSLLSSARCPILS